MVVVQSLPWHASVVDTSSPERAATDREPTPLSASERTALRQRWRTLVPLALVLISLISILAVLRQATQRSRARFDEAVQIIEPANRSLSTIELTLALDRLEALGVGAKRDTRLASTHEARRLERSRARAQLASLARQLSPVVVREAALLDQRIHSLEALEDSLYGGLAKIAQLGRLDSERARVDAVIDQAKTVRAAIDAETTMRRTAFAREQRFGERLLLALMVPAVLSLIALVRVGSTFRARAIRLDLREQEQSAIRETARALNASASWESARILTDGLMAGTTAIAAIVELALRDDPESSISAGIATRGTRARSENIDYENSLTRRLVQQPEATIVESAASLVDRIGLAPAMWRPDLSARILPVMSGKRVRGAIAVLREPANMKEIDTEKPYVGGLLEFATAVIQRSDLTRQLRDSEERFQQMADHIDAGVWLRDPNDPYLKYLYVSPAYERLSGRSRAELYEHPELWLESVVPEDRAIVAEVARGRRAPPYGIEYRIRRPDGEVRWLFGRAFPIRDKKGKIYRVTGITEDITERKQSEQAREELVKRERAARAQAESDRAEIERITESRSRLMRGFTHDVKNPLGAADGFLALLEEQALGPLVDKQVDGVRRARRSIHRALELITGALAIARADVEGIEIEPSTIALADVIEEVSSEFHASAAEKSQQLMTYIDDDLPVVKSDPARIRQVVGNLLSNAIKYTPPRGRIVVHACRANGRATPSAEWLIVDVSDTGPGIPENQFSRMFTEFARLSPGNSEGAGVGLAMSQRVATALGGRITLESQEGEGSRFSLWLPANGSPDSRSR